MSHQSKYLYEFGPFRLDVNERLLLRDGESISLTPKAFDLLLALVERHGRLVEKEELFQTVWPDTIVEESNLTYNISLIRKALGDRENGQKFIETVPKRGYRFVAEVRESPLDVHVEVAEALGVELAGARFVSRRWTVVAAIAVVLMIGLGYILYWLRQPAVQPDQIKSLAVLPLENLSGDPA